ncbi:unnamed protein product, partial [Didymodactylos carnosus]
TKKPAAATTATTSVNDFNEELDEIRIADNDQVSDECIEDSSDDSKADEDVPATQEQSTADEDESDTLSISSSSTDEEESLTPSQQERQVQEEEQELELENLLLHPEELKKKIYCLLKRTRTLISTIHKSSILTSFVRDEIQRKQIHLDTAADFSNDEKVKVNELVRDFHVRWNSTYLMLTRLLAVQQIINDITYTPQPRTGLTAK